MGGGPPAGSPDGHQATILFIEDREEDFLLVTRMLDEAAPGGFLVLHEARLIEGLALLSEVRIDLVLADLGLVESHGLGTIEAIQARAPHVPLVVLTSLKDAELGMEAVCRGAQDQLVREEITPGQVASTLRRSIARGRIFNAVKESELRFRTLFDNLADGILLADTKTHRFVMANQAICQMTGYSPTEIGRLGIRNLHPPADLSAALAAFERQVRGEVPLATNIPVRRKDGTIFHADINTARVVLDGRELVLGAFRDTTENRLLVSRLAQADRMVSVGLLAAGVAHEINNPLTYVMYNVETLAEDLPRATEVAGKMERALEEALGPERARATSSSGHWGPLSEELQDLSVCAQDSTHGARRVRDIVRDLRTFSKVEEDRKVPVKLEYAMECALNMAFNEIKYRARVIKEYGDTPHILASEGRLSQVFLNLIVNAAHSIEEGAVERNEIRLRTWTSKEEVLAEVRDSGKGIAPEHLDRLFEPFFTTKGPGFGSGLGLSICRTIVEGYGGRIDVRSRPGRGSRFVVRLPLQQKVEEPVPDAAEEWESDFTPVRGNVLVLDDERHIGEAIRRVLGDELEVTLVCSGREGKQILERNRNFDLIICDLMMPDLTGMDLHAWLQEVSPPLARRMLFITGGAFTPRARAFLKRVPNIRLEKPVEPRALIAIVRQALKGGV